MVICGDIALPIEVINYYREHDVLVVYGDHHKTTIMQYIKEGILPEPNETEKELRIRVNVLDNTSLFQYSVSDNNLHSGAWCLWYILYDLAKMQKCRFMQFTDGIELCSIYDTHQTDDPIWQDAVYLNAAAKYHHSRWATHKADYHLFMNVVTGDDVWTRGDKCTLQSYIEFGKTVDEVYAVRDKAFAASYSFPLTFHGIKFLAINTQGNTRVLDKVYDPEKYEAKMMFMYNPNAKKFVISMFGDDVHDIDLSAIAKQYPGGGGHKGACGFSCAKLPFDLPND